MTGSLPGTLLLQRWQQVCASGEKPALRDVGGTVRQTFAQLEEHARAWEQKLAGLPAGSAVGVKIGNHEDWPAIFLALLRLDLITLPLDQSLRGKAIEKVLATTGASALIHGSGPPEIRQLGKHGSVPGRGEVVLLKMTSGTTESPHLIRFTARQLLADVDHIVAAMGLQPDDLNYGVIPFSHSYGFNSLLTPLLCHGIPLVVAKDVFPRAILEGLLLSQATVLPGVPLIYQAILGLEEVRLPETLRLCISAGALLPGETVRQFHQRFGRKIHSFYGASECGGICYDHTEEPEVPPGFVGPAMPGVRVRFTPESGRIQVSGEAVGEGYFPQPQPQILGGGKFQPGDLLEKTSAGYRIAGRVSDFINVAGKKLNPREVETAIAQCDGVREVVVFGVECSTRGESIVAAVTGAPDLAEAAILRQCRRHLAAWQMPETVWFPGTIQTGARGKISRSELAERFSLTRSK